MRAATIALAATVLVGCGDPAGRCHDGNYREPGPGCAVPRIAPVIDGLGDEWTDPGLTPVDLCDESLEPCEPGDMQSLQGARDANGDALFLLRTVGLPAMIDTEYAISLSTESPLHADEVSSFSGRTTILKLSIRPDGVRVMIGFHEVSGLPPVDFAYGADGVELRIPAEVLITRGASSAYPQRRGPLFPGDTIWDAVQNAPLQIVGPYCWVDDVNSLCVIH